MLSGTGSSMPLRHDASSAPASNPPATTATQIGQAIALAAVRRSAGRDLVGGEIVG